MRISPAIQLSVSTTGSVAVTYTTGSSVFTAAALRSVKGSESIRCPLTSTERHTCSSKAPKVSGAVI